MKINFIKIFFVIFFILPFVLGCSPTYDWRVHYSKENDWQAFFPGKPFKKIRDLKLLIDDDPIQLKVTQNSTKIKKMVFTVDCSELLDDKIDTSQLSIKLVSSLEKNFKLKNKKKLSKKIYSYSGVFPSSKKPAVEIKLMTLTLSKENFVVRGVVYGQSESFLQNEAMFFLNSIK